MEEKLTIQRLKMGRREYGTEVCSSKIWHMDTGRQGEKLEAEHKLNDKLMKGNVV